MNDSTNNDHHHYNYGHEESNHIDDYDYHNHTYKLDLICLCVYNDLISLFFAMDFFLLILLLILGFFVFFSILMIGLFGSYMANFFFVWNQGFDQIIIVVWYESDSFIYTTKIMFNMKKNPRAVSCSILVFGCFFSWMNEWMNIWIEE